MAYITQNCINEIQTKGEIQNIVGEYVTLNSKLVGTCPFCDTAKKFSVSKPKNVWGCFKCGETGGGYVSFIQRIKGIEWIEALKLLAEKLNIVLEFDQNATAPLPQQKAPSINKKDKAPATESFRDIQLKESGLNADDQKYKRKTSETSDDYIEMDRYQKGSINPDWSIDASGDDMIMHYMDLNGHPMKYHRKNNTKDYPLIRVRYANPGAHLDQHGRPMKYQSPYGSGTHVWINQKLRDLYTSGLKIETLYIQEGEKKADKATKHSITSVGIMGIHNIAANKQLPREFELIIKKCAVENVVFIVDGDYLDISDNLTNPVDQRPKSFLRAIVNFHDYFYALNNSGISLNIFFGYIRNEHGEKGIDDLLTKVLPGKERELYKDLCQTLLEPNGIGQYINVHKITNMNEFKLRSQFFHMGTNEEFAKFHKAKLKERKIFKIGRENFKFSNIEEFPDMEPDTLVLAQPLSANEEFWEEKTSNRNGDKTTTTSFKYVKCCTFLNNRKFGRYRIGNKEDFKFIKVDGSVVSEIEMGYVRDYMHDFIENALQKENVLEMFQKGAKMYLSDNLNFLKYIPLKFHKADKTVQYMYFSDSFWKIKAEGIEAKPLIELDGHVWKDNIKDFKAELLPARFKAVKTPEGQFKIDFPNGKEAAAQCDFFNYLMNSSNFYWREMHLGYYTKKTPATPKVKLSDFQKNDMRMHFLSKCTAIGYLCHTYFDANCAKVVVAMDGKMSEVNDSNGRSGKTLLGEAVSNILPTFKIPGKQRDLMEDKFLWDGMTDAIRFVFIDDVRANFDIEAIFPQVTGMWKINPKGARSFTLKKEDSPKIYIPTNHAMNGDSSSFRDRQFLIAFSDYFNEDYRPIDDSGVLFFDEWSADKWNKFYNTIACCTQIYLEHGLIQAPMERLEKRRLRQQIGESMIDWAETFYDPKTVNTGDGRANLNNPVPRPDVTASFYTMFPEQRKYVDNRKFKKLLKKYCQFKGLEFNPGCEDNHGDDKRSGVEYFTVADESYKKS